MTDLLCADCLAETDRRSVAVAVTVRDGMALCGGHASRRASRPEPTPPAETVARIAAHVARVFPERASVPPGRCGNLPPRVVTASGEAERRPVCRLRFGHDGMHEDDDGAMWGPMWSDQPGPEETK